MHAGYDPYLMRREIQVVMSSGSKQRVQTFY